jgi:hypothetical protein
MGELSRMMVYAFCVHPYCSDSGHELDPLAWVIAHPAGMREMEHTRMWLPHACWIMNWLNCPRRLAPQRLLLRAESTTYPFGIAWVLQMFTVGGADVVNDGPGTPSSPTAASASMGVRPQADSASSSIPNPTLHVRMVHLPWSRADPGPPGKTRRLLDPHGCTPTARLCFRTSE